LFILIVAFRRGWFPTIEQGGDGKRSITALELEQAETLNIPTLTFLADDSWPVRLVEDSEGAFNWMRDFRNGLSRIATFFAFEQSVSTAADGVPIFRSKVREAFLNLREHQDHGGHVSAVQATPSASKPDDPPVRLKEPELSKELPPYHIQFWNLTSIRARSQEEIANWTKSCDNYACRD